MNTAYDENSLRLAITKVINTLKSHGVTQVSVANLSGVSRPQLNSYVRQDGGMSLKNLATVAKVLLSEMERISLIVNRETSADYENAFAWETAVLKQYVEQHYDLQVEQASSIKSRIMFRLPVSPDVNLLPLIMAIANSGVKSIDILSLIRLMEIIAQFSKEPTPESIRALLELM